MKMTLAALALALSVTMTGPQANAFAIIRGAATGDWGVGRPDTGREILAAVLCIALLPICLLEEETGGQVSKESLLENGYTQEEAMRIMDGQTALVHYLKANNLSIRRQGDLTKDQLIEFIRQISGVTPEYEQFVAEGF